MASYKITDCEPRANAQVALDVFVFPTGADTSDNANSVGHFTVMLQAAEVLAAFSEAPATRNALLKAMFESDTRIAGIVDAEAAATAMDGAFSWPLVLEL
jgi:hypothetical protein